MAGEWKGQRTVGISDRTCLWLVDSERNREAKKRSVKKRGIPPSIMQTEFIHVEKFSEKTPHSYQGCCCSELWPLGISFCSTIKPWILGATESYVLQQMLTHATQGFTFSFSPLLKGWSCLPLSSDRPFFLIQKSKPKYLKMEGGESGWKDKRQDRKQSQQAAA